MSKILKKIKKVLNFQINRLIQKQGGPVITTDGSDARLIELSRISAEEGIVLLKNNGVLPFTKEHTVSVFGRVQKDYFFCGYGSGGDVKSPYKVSMLDALEKQTDFPINHKLTQFYRQWCDKNRPDDGFWGHWPHCYEEMVLTDEQIRVARKESDTAVYVIGRSSGEDREAFLEKGSYYLQNEELNLLRKITTQFERVVLVFNIGSIMDFSFLSEFGDCIKGIVIAWQGGMESGNALVNVLSGRTTPSGKLTDTIPVSYEHYPNKDDFGDSRYNNYTEDIYVGYRYFNTFAEEAILYPFGYGLSYTTFNIEIDSLAMNRKHLKMMIKVTNTGSMFSGKQVVEIFGQAPNGALGKPRLSLVAFQKTKNLSPNEAQVLTFEFDLSVLASFDDTGKTGFSYAWVLEKGPYRFWIGESANNLIDCVQIDLNTTELVEQLEPVMPLAPEEAFNRLVSFRNQEQYIQKTETVPTRINQRKDRIIDRMPSSLPYKGDQGYQLKDVANGIISLDDFVCQLTDEELATLTHGYGPMDCPLGIKGNAGCFGGLNESLQKKGIPPITTTDGPSGIRSMYQASLLPIGTLLACTWNTELVEELFILLGEEMKKLDTDMLLAPGMNIHRNPLCGRNFEYFSEDPLLSGKIASAIVRGIQKNGSSACPKHFACNNQETKRNEHDARVSERALREIYLKGFEICVKEGKPQSIMTSYNKINGVWSHYNYDLATTVLRKEWGFQGVVITDWWMQRATDPDFPSLTNNAYRIRAQVDVLMPGCIAYNNAQIDGTLLSSLQKKDGITRAEMLRSAKNVLQFILQSRRFHKDLSEKK